MTTLERTLLDEAERLDERQLEHALVEADRSGNLRWPHLLRLVDEAKGRKGRARLWRVARQVDPSAADTRSPGEVDFLALCRKAGLPLPRVNVLVEGHLADFLWPKARVIVETDSYGYHRDRRAFEHDHASTIELMTAGYRVLRVTYRMLQDDPIPFLGLVRGALSGQ